MTVPVGAGLASVADRRAEAGDPAEILDIGVARAVGAVVTLNPFVT